MFLSVPSLAAMAIWVALLAVALWAVAAIASPAAWLAFAVVGIMPPLMWRRLSQQSSRTIAEVIHDAEVER